MPLVTVGQHVTDHILFVENSAGLPGPAEYHGKVVYAPKERHASKYQFGGQFVLAQDCSYRPKIRLTPRIAQCVGGVE